MKESHENIVLKDYFICKNDINVPCIKISLSLQKHMRILNRRILQKLSSYDLFHLFQKCIGYRLYVGVFD